MGRGGRPRKHDPIADAIQREIRAGSFDLVKSLITEAGTDVLDGEARTPLIYSAQGGTDNSLVRAPKVLEVVVRLTHFLKNLLSLRDPDNELRPSGN